MTLPTEADFTAVTTDSRRKRHWCLTADLRNLSAVMPGRTGWTLCGGYNSMDQQRLNHWNELWNTKAVTIVNLPSCKQCDKSKARRLEGRPS